MEDLEERVARILNDRDHGSRWLVREALQLLLVLASEEGVSAEQRLARMRTAGVELAQARPAMAALAGAMRRVLAAGQDASSLAAAAGQLLRDSELALEQLTSHARPLLRGTIMTHSLSGTVLEVLRACIPPIQHVIIPEGRPLYEGRALADALSDLQVQLTLITDAQAEIFLPICQAFVTGADCILADGGILNKAGTVLIARAARAHDVPFYVLSETLKCSSLPWTGDLQILEEHPGKEVWERVTARVSVRNFYFDYTPGELITTIITEQGLLKLE